MRLGKAAVVLAAACVPAAAFLLAGPTLVPGTAETVAERTAPPAVPAPEVEFRSLHGSPASLKDYRGQVVLLNLWGTWCPPCVREIPHLVEVQERIEPLGGTVIGLAVDSGTPEEILAFWEGRLELEPAYPLWTGTNREARRHFDAFGLPNTLIIDRDGFIRDRFLGLVTREMLLEALEAYL